MKRSLLLSLLLAAPAALADGPMMTAARKGTDLWATLVTTQGTIVLKLFSKDAPRTVENFVGLAAGEREFIDRSTGQSARRRFYDGLTFHRVIPGFMIQGGDPAGNGSGGPGYSFEDEFSSGRGFDRPGLLAMANRGPNTNGSQFFITTSTPTYLNGRHTIFGEVVSGHRVLDAIGAVPRGAGDKPVTPVVMKKVTVSTRGPVARPARKKAP